MGPRISVQAMEDGVDALLENDGDVHALIQAWEGVSACMMLRN